ncbi:hypothetical protein SYJ56_19870 [Algoriphagus sp. D3-2-R+10]|uniref:hypothetical protein n=1 Tax=Algoriphagus aurantiacus TaxID=3103948 RepID=UPI002B3DF5BB|nr:hypothetical protein [Algoriphagus sp. D3-2-R+10]MEB2777584.1 hypothetical protein [Algoriphagus sp. D3-2-R+10]
MKTIFKFLDKPSNLVILFALFLFFNFLLISFISPYQVLDLRFAYSANEAFKVIKNMGESMRGKYLFVIWALDSPYMIVYLLLLIGLIRKLWKQKKFLILPFIIAGLDLFENIMVSSLLLSFPFESKLLGYFASFFTTTKWLCVGVCVVFLIVGLVRNYVFRKEPNLDLKR